MCPHKARTRSPTEKAGVVTGATRETVRQFGHAVNEPRRVVAVPTAPAICARHAAWNLWLQASATTPPSSNDSRHIEHWSMDAQMSSDSRVRA